MGKRRPRLLALLTIVAMIGMPISAFQSIGGHWAASQSLRLESALWAAPPPSLNVALDQPLLSEGSLFTTKKKSFLGSLASAAFSGKTLRRLAVVTLLLAVIGTLILDDSAVPSILRALRVRLERLRGRLFPQPVEGVPMPFDDESNEGWGACTLRSKRKLGKTSFVQYEFELPSPEYTLPLTLGQTINLCCLDSDQNVAKGEFYPFYLNKRPGSFTLLAPSPDESRNNELIIGIESANFVRVLDQDLKEGHEIALKPGGQRLQYRGAALPVTNMVYIACGVGIAPVVEQVQTVLTSQGNSVSQVTVLWLNESPKDFDVTSDLLEEEYHSHSSRLAVSCVVIDTVNQAPDITTLAANEDISSTIPEFTPGTMAVLSGPMGVMRTMMDYLADYRGFPSDTMCVL